MFPLTGYAVQKRLGGFPQPNVILTGGDGTPQLISKDCGPSSSPARTDGRCRPQRQENEHRHLLIRWRNQEIFWSR